MVRIADLSSFYFCVSEYFFKKMKTFIFGDAFQEILNTFTSQGITSRIKMAGSNRVSGSALALAFLFVFINITAASTPWHSETVNIYNCNSVYQIFVRRVLNNSRAKFIVDPSLPPSWIQYQYPENVFLQMYAIKKNGKLFFLEVRGGSLRIIQNDAPTGVARMDDPRLFNYHKNTHTGRDVLMHVATKTYVSFRSRPGLATAVNDPALALDICLVHPRNVS